jgi:hypothetical protein
VSCDMWHVTHDTWHVTRLGGWTFSQNFSSLALTVCDLWYYEDLEEKDEWINEWINKLINYEAVYRTAPATPGLLKIYRAFLWVLIEDLSPNEDLFCEVVLIWSSLKHQVLICSLSSWSGMTMKKVCRFLIRCVTFCCVDI